MVKKYLRRLYLWYILFNSFLRKIKIGILYNNVDIDRFSLIEKGSKIICIEGGKIIIKNSTISQNTHIVADIDATIMIQNSFIGKNASIVAKKGIIISNDCLIAENVTIRDQDHLFADRSKKINEQGYKVAPIILEENVWVGCNVTILKGVTLKYGTVVGAGSVVDLLPKNRSD